MAYEEGGDFFIDSLASGLKLDRRSVAAAILHFTDGLPHAEVGERLGLPEVEARDLAYKGLRDITEASYSLPLDSWRMAAPYN